MNSQLLIRHVFMRLFATLVRTSNRVILLLGTGGFLALLPGCSQLAHDPPVQYKYQAPDGGNPDWPVSSLEAAHINTQPVEALTNLIRTEKYRNIHSLLIVRHGKLVYEQYFNGYSAEVPQNMYSASKSITSALIGIALEKGMIKNVDEKALLFFPQYATVPGLDPHKQAITLRHLLTMSSGLACNDDAGEASPGFEATMSQSSDWIKFTLELPMAHEPGSVSQYCTAGVVTLGGILKKASGMPVQAFAEQYLFAPLAIKPYRWSLMPDSQASTGGKLFLRPRDMAKIGQLFLNKGNWNGEQLISEEYVAAATQKQVMLRGLEYGYQWWRRKFMVQNQTFDTYFAWGNGGQYICVVPQCEVVVVSTAGNLNTPLTNQFFSMLQSHLLPALR